MFRRIKHHLARVLLSFLFALGLLIGGLATPASAASTAPHSPSAVSHATRPQWGPLPNSRGSQYPCCYTGKGEDVLFIHGVDGSGSGANGNDPNGNCHVNFGAAVNVLTSYQWVGNLINLEYYSGEHGHCVITNSDPQNFETTNIHDTPHASNCNGYYDTPSSAIGTNNEDDRHLACLLAWYIWDHYTRDPGHLLERQK